MQRERISTVKGHRYRQIVKSVWDSEKKRSRTVVVKHLGPVVEDRAGKLRTSIRIDGVEKACQAGHLALYYTIAREFSLDTCLQQISQDDNVANALMALIFNQLNNHKPLTKIGPWLNETPIARWMGIEGNTFTKDVLSHALDSICFTKGDVTTKYTHAIQKLASAQWQSKVGMDPAHYYFYYDVARIRYHGTHCPLAEPGYGPIAKGRPHIGYGLNTSKNNHFPIYSTTIKGSIHDSVTFKEIADNLAAWDMCGLTMIMDRGIMNKKTTMYARENELHVLGGCMETSDEVKNAIRLWNDDEIEKSTQVFLRASEGEIYYYGWRGKLYGEDGLLVITMDPERRTRERGTRDRLLYRMRNDKTTLGKNDIRKELGKIVVPSVGRTGWRIDSDAETDARRADGRFLLFTTDTKMTPEEVVGAYYQRDEIEKAFRDMNGAGSMGPIRYRLPNHVDPYLTVICHLAYLIRMGIQWKLKKAKRAESVDQVVEILQEINEVILTSKDKNITKWTNLTKEQESLVKLFKLNELIPRY